jgi:hypothetical protein
MSQVRVQNKRGEWLRRDHKWSKRREEAAVFDSIPAAEDELERAMIGWLGQVMFDISEP